MIDTTESALGKEVAMLRTEDESFSVFIFVF